MSSSPLEGSLGDRIERLLGQARAGLEEALGELFEAFRPLLLAQSRARLPQELQGKLGSSDLAQITYQDAQRDFLRFTGSTPEEFRTWLVRIHEHNIYNEVRRYKGTRMRDQGREVSLNQSAPDLIDSGPSPSEAASHKEEEELLHQALGCLPGDERELVLLRQNESLAWEQVAERLHYPSAGAASKKWSRVLEKLQGLIETIRREGKAGP